MATEPTTSDLFKAKTITDTEVNAAVEVVMAGRTTRMFRFASGHVLNLPAAVEANRHAVAMMSEPTATDRGKRLAVRTAILLARSKSP